jgi:hypothetical protein
MTVWDIKCFAISFTSLSFVMQDILSIKVKPSLAIKLLQAACVAIPHCSKWYEVHPKYPLLPVLEPY